MNKKIFLTVFLIFVVVIITGFFVKKHKKDKILKKNIIKILPSILDIKRMIKTTGVIEPQNRVEIVPPMAGRIEEIFVKEGDIVKKGDVLMKMSSTERAALIDNASSKGESYKKYWEDLYKPTPIVASIDGEVIARDVEPGQTVSASTIVLVLSNKLIVKANVDETDVGDIKIGQRAEVFLDAYPNIRVMATVEHIAYESTVINNVTTYTVDIVPDTVPNIYKSGMSSNINIILDIREKVLSVPLDVIIYKDNKQYVKVAKNFSKNKKSKDFILKEVTLGISDGEMVEIKEGLNDKDNILYEKQVIDINNSYQKNPFMMQGPNRKK